MSAADTTDRSALLLSGSLGMGHDVMAQACEVSLSRRGWQTELLDSLRLMGATAGDLGEKVFRGLMRTPGLYDAFHFEQLRPGGRLARYAERSSSRYLVPALREQLDDRPAALLISVFATGAAAASRVKAEHPGLVTWVFCTDVCPHRLWVHADTDLFLVTSEAARRYVRRYEPRAEVEVVPAPVRPQFYNAPDRTAARASLGVDPAAACVLLMSGSWGIGPLVQAAEAIADAGVQVLAVAGRNEQLAGDLRVASRRRRRIVPFGFTDQVPTLMSAADLVITSSGDTCSEARVLGRDLLLLDVIAGHGRENLQHELERGHADIAPNEPGALADAALACLDRIAAAGPPEDLRAITGQRWEAAIDSALARFGLLR